MPIWAITASGRDMEASVKEDRRWEGDPFQRVPWSVPHSKTQEALQFVDGAAEARASP